MFGIFRGLKKGMLGNEVMGILARNYQLSANPNGIAFYVDRLANTMSNPHELAIMYLADQVQNMEKGNPEHTKRAVRYIRVAKQAHKTGQLGDRLALQELEVAATNTLGIDPDTIAAAPG